MTTTVNLDNDAIARAGLADPEHHGIQRVDDEKHQYNDTQSITTDDNDWPDKPTPEQMRTLRRVSGKIKWAMWTIAFVELCERFSYYGSAVLYTNFVQPRPAPWLDNKSYLKRKGQGGKLAAKAVPVAKTNRGEPIQEPLEW
ncbi:hypothetical protein NQ176_g6339 [Zarea fungicola]|uniref:Uncharacterized protein n=1 Tax=Zarea fungicola TaxID=93591 RepID=A0ACC1N3U2_9HYPO|nr:hypothetical protein NQ176_g6339 [Lecanicillium fungicola]